MGNKFKRFLALMLAVVMVIGMMPQITIDAKAEETTYVAKIGETGYVNFDEAMTAANAMTGDVVVDVYGEVEFADGMELNGSYTSITFNGKAAGAKITINQTAGGDYLEAHGKTVAFNDLTLAKANPAWSGNSGHMGNYFSVQGGTVTYNNCTFPNGACTSGGTATYTGCTFQNTSEYGLWVYDDALVTVNGGTIDSKKGIKVYSEDEASVTSTLTVQNATFTENVTAKPAVAVGYAESITLIGNTYKNTTAVVELDSGSDADCEGITFVAQDAEGNDIASTLTVVDRSNNSAACGVLVDGKIYTTVAQAAEVATSGSTVTLLHDSTETVELPEGVTLNTNGHTAENVTVKQPAATNVAQIGTKGYETLQAAIDAVQNGETIELLGDVTEATVTIDKASGVAFTIDGKGFNFTGKFDLGIGENITIQNIDFVASAEISPDYFIDGFGQNSNSVLNILNCTFTDTDYSTTAIGTQQPTKVVIDGCTATGVASLMQNQGGYDITVKNTSIEGKRGISLGTVVGATVENVTINAADDKYGIRLNGEIANNTITIKDCDIQAFIPVVVRKAQVENYEVIFEGTNTMTAKNTDSLWMAIGSDEYDTNGQMPTDPTGKVTVTLNDPGLNADGVYGNYVEPPKGSINGGLVNMQNANRTFLTIESYITYANESIVVKVFDANGTLLATSTLVDTNRVLLGTKNFSLSTMVGINCTDEWWNTVWEADKLRADYVPAKATLYVDGVEMNTASIQMRAAGSETAVNWAEVPGVPGVPVAMIGETKYTSLQDAVNAGGDITLLADVTENITIADNATIVLDLNGKTLNGYIAPCKPTSLTVKNGSIVNTNSAYSAIEINAGELVLEDVNVTSTRHAVRIDGAVTATINGGEYKVNATSGTRHAVNVSGAADVTIKAGTFVGPRGTTMDSGAAVNVQTGATVTIEGGNFSKGKNNTLAADGTLVVKGGTFDQVPSAYLPEGYAALPDLNGNYVVGAKPTATVNDLGMTTVAAGDYMVYGNGDNTADMPLSFVMQFLADQKAEDMATSPFADWYGDFVITFTGIEGGSFTADGCYLAGHYGSFGWVKVPVDGLTIVEGTRYPVMLGVGMGQKYDYICSSVQDFKCALYLTPEILAANPNIQVKLELAVVDNSQGSDAAASALVNNKNVYSVTDYTYDAEDFVVKTYVAQIGDVKYETLAEAVAAAVSGDEIIVLADVTEDVTVPAGVTFNGNGMQVGAITAAGEITFKGHTKATSFSVQYTGTTINIGEGACLEITGTGRMVIGHGCTFNITGSITDAKTADTAELTPSLIAPGASFTGAGVNFNVTNAYVKFTAYCSSKNSAASGTFNINVTNSIWEQTGSLLFSVPTNEKDPTFNFNVKDSVLNSTSHLVFAVTKGEIVFDNSNVNVGTSRQIENRSTLTIKNGSVVNGAVATSSNAINPGTLIIENATYSVTGEFSGTTVGTGTIVIKDGASFTAGKITNANIQIDAANMSAGDEINLTADLSGLTGTVTVINNDSLVANIVDNKIVLSAKPVASVTDAEGNVTEYTTLAEALTAAQAGDTVKIMAGTYALPSMKAGITIEGEVNEDGTPAVLLEGTLSGTLENLTLKNLHIKGANAQRWAYAKGNLVFENVTFEATSVYALHFDGITEGATLLYKDCTIIGWAAMSGSPASCVFDGCTIKDNGTYGVIRTYFDATIENCTFDVDGANTTDVYQDGIHAVSGAEVTVNNCTNANGDMENLVNVSGTSVVVLDGVEIKNVAKIGDTYYLTLTEAITAATAGDTITLIADITEDVTVSKSLTIDGDNHKYTGNISVSGTSSAVTVKNVNFVDGTYYAIKTDNINSITVENCTVKNYAYGFLYANKSTPTIVVKNVTVDGGNYGFHWARGISATLEDVTMTNVYYGVYAQNYAGKTITLKNCSISGTHPIDVWERDGYSGMQTFKFEGENTLTVDAMTQSAYAKLVLSTADATLTAPADLDVTTTVADSKVVYENGVYKIAPLVYVAQIGETKYESIQEAVKAAADDAVITVIADHELVWDGVTNVDGLPVIVAVDGKTVTIDLNGKKLTGTSGDENLALYAAFAVDNDGSLTLKDSVGTASVEITGTSTMYSLLMAYEYGANKTTKLIVEGGSYYLENAHDCLIFCGQEVKDIVYIKGGTFKLGNVGTGENGKPWIFNVVGAGGGCANITGGTFNADINNQFWSSEAVVDETCYVVNTGNGTWTVKAGAAAYVQTTKLTGPYDYQKNIGYATLEEAIAAAVQYNDPNVTLLKDITISETLVINGNVNINGNGKKITGSENLVEINADLTLNNVVMEPGKYDYALVIKSNDCDVVLNDCSITGPIKGYGTSQYIINSGIYKKGNSAFSSMLNGAVVYGGTFYYEIPAKYCAPGYVVVDNGDGTWTVKYDPACFIDADNDGVLDEGEAAFGSLEALFAENLSGEVTVVLLKDVSTASVVDTAADTTYNFVTYVDGGVTMDWNYTGGWNYIQNASIGENITLNVPYRLCVWTKLDVYGTINTGYFYLYGGQTTIHEEAVVNANTGEATTQVKNGTVLTVNGTLNTSTLNVWVGESKLVVSGANAKVDASWIDIWDGAPSVTVEEGATLAVESIKASRGGEITVDNATLDAGSIELGHNGESAGTMAVINNGVVTTEIELTVAGSTVEGPESLNVTTNIADHKVVYENGVHKVVEKVYVAQIGETKYETFKEALNAVKDGETIIVLNVESEAELGTEIEFTKDIEFTITGKAPKYALPVVTFQNATVNIKDAEILIPELDARQNATINVVDSIVHDAGGNGIVKSYYNGAINISGNSVVYTMQVTTMGYITISDTAKLNATWQTNVYGNGKIVVEDDATFATAALHLTAQDYSNRDNTDADRVGKPATIVVDGATFIVGKVYSDNGADYSYNSSKGINIGTVDSKSAVLDIKNGATVEVYMANGETANIGANGTVNVDASSFTVACRAADGKVTLANNGTIKVSGASDIAANVTGEGWVYMNCVTLDADTKLYGAKVAFINGTNTVAGSVIDDGFFSVGVGQNAAAATAAAFAEANGITLGDVTVNVSGDAIIGANGATYSGWVGSAYSADKTQYKYVLNIENSLATFGYMHVSKDGELNVKGHATNKYTYDNANVDFYAGELIVNGVVTLDGTDAWAKFTKMSVDAADGVLNIVNGTNFESSIHNGSNTSTSLMFWKAGEFNVDATSKVEIDNGTVLVEGAELNIAGAVIAKGAVTGNGTISLTDAAATLTAADGLTVTTTVENHEVKYEDGVYVVKEIVDELFEIEKLSMRFGSDLSLLFAFKQSNVETLAGSYASISRMKDGVRSEPVIVNASEWTTTTISGEKYYIVEFAGFAAKEMTDNVYVTIYDAEGNALSKEKVTSIRDYAMEILGKTQNEDYKIAIVDMLNYGYAAQDYFDDYNIDVPANGLLTDEQKALASDLQKVTDEREKDDAYFAGSNLRFVSKINLIFRMNISKETYAVFTWTDHNGKQMSVRVDNDKYTTSSGFYVVELEELVVADARQKVTCTIYNLSDDSVVTKVVDSVESNVARRTPNTSALYEAFMKFADSAHYYLHNK